MVTKSRVNCQAVASGSIDSILEKFSSRKVGRHILQAWLRGDHHRLLNIHLNPSGYSDVESFRDDYFVVSLLKKYPALDLGIDRARVALDGFLDCESRCSETNVRFCNLTRSISGEDFALLVRARAIVLGILKNFSWDEAVRHCDFGPGASVGIKRRDGHVGNKIGHPRPTVTGQCHTLLSAYRAWDPHLREAMSDAIVVDGSVITTVPKDARKDRVIAIEPLWNMFFQKGIGGLIRSRLRRIGLDLSNQQPINQLLARIGSETNHLATVDLSAASDCMALEFVRWLLPADWFDALCVTRSPVATLPDGNKVFLRKISSMGNGYTFELESLVFLALSLACSPEPLKLGRDVAVFGDDIIVPGSVTRVLQRVLHLCGFAFNNEKSFVDGPFRESCGKHFFRGRDVTPIYLRKKVTTTPLLLSWANALIRCSHRFTGGLYRDMKFKEAVDLCRSKLPGRLKRPSIPDSYGDGAIIGDFDECAPRPIRDRNHVEGWDVPSLLPTTAVKQRFDGPVALTISVWSTRCGRAIGGALSPLVSTFCAEGGRISLRSDPTWNSGFSTLDEFKPDRLRIGRIRVTQWPYLGPWA